MQVTFKIADVEKLISGKTGNLLITIENGKASATIVPAAGAKTAAAAAIVEPTIDGCPFPPGCTQ